jgi:hypothetical protein
MNLVGSTAQFKPNTDRYTIINPEIIDSELSQFQSVTYEPSFSTLRVENILRRCGLWDEESARPPPPQKELVGGMKLKKRRGAKMGARTGF